MTDQSQSPVVLLVDDEPEILRALERDLHGLVQEGALTIETARTTTEAWDLLEARGQEVALVLCDLAMPGERGTKFLKKVTREYPNLVLEVLTGHSVPDDIQDFLDASVFAFLTKPWTKVRLVYEIQRGLQHSALKARNAAYQATAAKELAQAQQFQRQLLQCRPPQDPRLGFDIFQRNAPDHAFSGDFVDVRQLGPDRWLMVLADVAGHGLKAAFTVALVKSILDADVSPLLAEPDFDPGKLATWLNQKVVRYVSSPAGGFVSFLAVEIDLSSRRCRWVNAGQPPLFVLRVGEVVALDETNLPLGISAQTQYLASVVDFPVGSRIFLCTDGIYPTGLDIPEFTPAFFKRFLESASVPGLTLEFKVNTLISRFQERCFSDDITVIELSSKVS